MMGADQVSQAARAPARAFTALAVSHRPDATASPRPAAAASTGLGRQFKVLQDRGAPAQRSLFQRPAGR